MRTPHRVCRAYLVVSVFLFLISLWSAAQAVLPTTLSYQAYLTDAGGLPIHGTVDITFRLYTVESGGTPVWEETQTVTVSKGVLGVQLGAVSPLSLPDSFAAPVWLGVQIAGEAEEMSPRRALTLTAYAVQAVNADTVDGQDASALDQSAHVADTTGNPHQIRWANLQDIPAGFADDVDNDSGGDITAVITAPGSGLLGGWDSEDVSLSVNFAGDGNAASVARSDHAHDTRYYTRTELNSAFAVVHNDIAELRDQINQLSVRIAELEFPLVAVDDQADGYSGLPVVIDPLQNDSGDNGTGLRITAVTNPANGVAEISNDLTLITYTSTPGFVGQDSFQYTMKRNSGADTSASATITVNVIRGKVVFVTENSYNGNLGGVTGADLICQGDAANAGLSGSFKAWISDSSSDPADRFTPSNEAYVRIDGVIVANNWADLTDGNIAAPIAITESGNLRESRVWTFTSDNGQQKHCCVDWHCDNWTSGASDMWGDVGRSSKSGPDGQDGWSDISTLYYCDSSLALYCFEQ